MSYSNTNKFNSSYSAKKVNRVLPFRKCFPSTLVPVGRSYAGIGARNAPESIKPIVIKLGYYLALEGFVLRSGGAEGMDDFFEAGADLAMMVTSTAQKQIFLPEENSWGNPSVWHNPSEKAQETVEIYHKYGKNMKGRSRNLMARNAHQVLGADLNDPAKFIICWTKDGCLSDETRSYDKSSGTGGTGQAISIASLNNIPVFNLQNKEHLDKIMKKLAVWEEKHGPCPDVNLLKNAKPKSEARTVKI